MRLSYRERDNVILIGNWKTCCDTRDSGVNGECTPWGRSPHSLVRMRSPVQIWLAAPKPLKSTGFRGFLLLFRKISSQKFKLSNSAKTTRPHPFLPLFKEGMRSDDRQKNHENCTQWTVGGGGVSGLHFCHSVEDMRLIQKRISTFMGPCPRRFTTHFLYSPQFLHKSKSWITSALV